MRYLIDTHPFIGKLRNAMRKWFVVISLAFLAGFVLGHRLQIPSLPLVTVEKQQIEDNVKENPRNAELPAPPMAAKSSDNSVQVATLSPRSSSQRDAGVLPDAVSNQTRSNTAKNDTQETKPFTDDPRFKYPPPHVGNPYFFGSNPEDPETLRLRQLALEDYIAAMEQEGLPEGLIQAVREVYEHDIRGESDSVDESSDEPRATPEEEAENIARSLEEGNEPDHTIQALLDHFWLEVAEQDAQDSDAAGAGEAPPEPPPLLAPPSR